MQLNLFWSREEGYASALVELHLHLMLMLLRMLRRSLFSAHMKLNKA